MQCAEVMFRNDFTINNMKQDEIFFLLILILFNDILDIYKYLMKRIWYKIILGLIKKNMDYSLA